MTGFDLSDAAARRALGGLGGGVQAAAVYAAAAWSVITEPGDGVAGRLLAVLGPVEALARAALEDVPGDVAEAAGVTPQQLQAAAERWRPRLDQRAVDSALVRARAAGAALLTRGDPRWPHRLDDLGPHAPHCLWIRGSVDGLDSAATLAIVGARAASGYGDHVAGELAAALAADGVVVVSGAAYGIDGAAHRGALGPGGRTIALLAGGVDRPYPAGHADLIARIAREGAVVSETPCGTAPSKWRFLARNRLIAALSDATVVVEAGIRSGSLNTAAHAAELGRPLGAVPGQITSASSAGCHRILREYPAVCITGPDDVRELLGLTTSSHAPAGARTDDLTRLLDAASTRAPRSVADLARRSGLAVAEVEALLGLAALTGGMVSDGTGWRRAPSG